MSKEPFRKLSDQERAEISAWADKRAGEIADKHFVEIVPNSSSLDQKKPEIGKHTVGICFGRQDHYDPGLCVKPIGLDVKPSRDNDRAKLAERPAGKRFEMFERY